MCVYLRTKFKNCSTVVTSFTRFTVGEREGGTVGRKRTPKKPTQIRVNTGWCITFKNKNSNWEAERNTWYSLWLDKKSIKKLSSLAQGTFDLLHVFLTRNAVCGELLSTKLTKVLLTETFLYRNSELERAKVLLLTPGGVALIKAIGTFIDRGFNISVKILENICHLWEIKLGVCYEINC